MTATRQLDSQREKPSGSEMVLESVQGMALVLALERVKRLKGRMWDIEWVAPE